MRHAQINDPIAAAALDALDDEIATVLAEEARAAEVAGVDAVVTAELGADAAVLDAVIEQAEREWAATAAPEIEQPADDTGGEPGRRVRLWVLPRDLAVLVDEVGGGEAA